MNIYRVQDRMLDHWGPPFLGANDKDVLAALATAINSGDKQNAFCQAPHHFDLWKIGHIKDEVEDGQHVTAIQGLICTLDSLVRGSIREESNQQPTNKQMESPAPTRAGLLSNSKQIGRAYQPATPNHPPQPKT